MNGLVLKDKDIIGEMDLSLKEGDRKTSLVIPANFDKNGNINPEVAKELQDWHRTHVDETHHEEHLEDYVHPHKSGERVFRHIHINHGPDLEKAIDAVKEEISKNEAIRSKYSTRFLAI